MDLYQDIVQRLTKRFALNYDLSSFVYKENRTTHRLTEFRFTVYGKWKCHIQRKKRYMLTVENMATKEVFVIDWHRGKHADKIGIGTLSIKQGLLNQISELREVEAECIREAIYVLYGEKKYRLVEVDYAPANRFLSDILANFHVNGSFIPTIRCSLRSEIFMRLIRDAWTTTENRGFNLYLLDTLSQQFPSLQLGRCLYRQFN